ADLVTGVQTCALPICRMEALRRADPSPLQSIYADDYSLVTPSGVVRSKAEQIDDLKSGRVRYGKIETIERNVRIYGDVAIVLSRSEERRVGKECESRR